jgi:chorismate synthase
MPGNTIGRLLRLTSFGESHGPAIGGIIDGFPSGIAIDTEFLQQELDKRKPGQSEFSSPRKESDHLEILSGVFQGVSLGTPIAFIIRNHDARPEEYNFLADTFRPSHADYTYTVKYGIRDHRGGGRASARETAVRVAAGGFAKLFLLSKGIKVQAFTDSIGPIKLQEPGKYTATPLSLENPLKCPDIEASILMQEYLQRLAATGDSCGGTVFCIIQGAPAGLGEPVFQKMESELASAMLSINACTGFEYGSGFAGAASTGSANNDQWNIVWEGENPENPRLKTITNHSGGIQGGITNGEDICFRTAFKPVASIRQVQQSFNSKGEEVTLKGGGRHDVCIVPRAVAIVEAMASLVIADLWLQHNAYKSL